LVGNRQKLGQNPRFETQLHPCNNRGGHIHRKSMASPASAKKSQKDNHLCCCTATFISTAGGPAAQSIMKENMGVA
jgi:hypothetical protein